jgi:hypothetical protein
MASDRNRHKTDTDIRKQTFLECGKERLKT